MATVKLNPYMKEQFDVLVDWLRGKFALVGGDKDVSFKAKAGTGENDVVVNSQLGIDDSELTEAKMLEKYNQG